jgi:hypothetical protein
MHQIAINQGDQASHKNGKEMMYNFLLAHWSNLLCEAVLE